MVLVLIDDHQAVVSSCDSCTDISMWREPQFSKSILPYFVELNLKVLFSWRPHSTSNWLVTCGDYPFICRLIGL